MKLQVNDRVRIVRLPPIWSRPDWHVPKDTIKIYKALIARGRPVRIRLVDRNGPWFDCYFNTQRGRERHAMTVDDGCWVKVKSRPATKKARKK